MTVARRAAIASAIALALAPTAPLDAQSRDACADLLRHANTHINTTGRTHGQPERTIRLSNERCQIDVRLIGEPTFTSDFRAVAALPGGGSFRLEEASNGVRRMLELDDDGRGGVIAAYRVGREARAFDAAAEAWFADRLQLLFRRTGLAAEQRAAWLIRSGGLPALLAEAELVQSSSGRATYLRHALGHPGLDDAAVVRLLRSSLPSSSTARADVLRAAVEGRRLDGPVGAAYLDAVADMSSSSRQRELLEHALAERRASDAFLLRALEVTGRISSSTQQSALLRAVATQYTLDDALLAGWLDTLTRISSSSAQRAALIDLVTEQELTDGQLARALRSVRSIASSSAQGEVLVHVARSRRLHGEARQAYVDAATSISSSSQRARALEALERGPARQGSL